jgi:hypothetical protein
MTPGTRYPAARDDWSCDPCNEGRIRRQGGALGRRSSAGAWALLFHALTNPVSKALTKVKSLWPNPWHVIALHSPNALRETGLSMCPPEKSQLND